MAAAAATAAAVSSSQTQDFDFQREPDHVGHKLWQRADAAAPCTAYEISPYL